MASLARHNRILQRLLQQSTKPSTPLRRLTLQQPTQTATSLKYYPRHYTSSTVHRRPPHAQEPLIPAPTDRTGPLLERLPNRALPSISTGLSSSTKLWLKTLPVFIALITIASLSIFNYQKSSSSTVNSILYALRTHPQARELLGDEIYFASKVPWIHGELNQLHGIIDIKFWVKGTRGKAETRFVSMRKKRDGYFETLEWSLKGADGKVVQLLGEGNDPMAGVSAEIDV